MENNEEIDVAAIEAVEETVVEVAQEEAVTDENKTGEDQVLEISDRMIENLITAGKWGTFIAIIGYISSGMMILAGIGMTIFMVVAGSIGDNPIFDGILPMSLFGLLYVGLGAVYCIPSYLLYTFSDNVKKGGKKGDILLLEDGIEKLKSLMKFVGIMIIVGLGMYVLLIVGALIVGVVMGVSGVL